MKIFWLSFIFLICCLTVTSAQMNENGVLRRKRSSPHHSRSRERMVNNSARQNRIQPFGTSPNFDDGNHASHQKTPSAPASYPTSDIAWERHYASQNISSNDFTADVKVDAQGNIIVLAYTDSYITGQDILVIKYDANGEELWKARYNSPANLDDIPSGFTVDANGNIYVTGTRTNGVRLYGIVTIKYNSMGAEQWVSSYGGTEDTSCSAGSVCADGAGNVFITGTNYDPVNGMAFLTIGYNSAGIQLWNAQFNQFDDNDAMEIGLDANANIYVGGISYDTNASLGFTLVKYNSAGAQQWATRYDSPGGENYLREMLCDATGNIYLTGESYDVDTLYYEIVTLKYNSAGALQWAKRYGGTSHSDNIPYDLDFDNSGNVYITGDTYDDDQGIDNSITIKYSTTGTQRWAKRFAGGDDDAIGNSVAVDSSGNVFLEGFSSGAVFLLKYNSTGAEQWNVIIPVTPSFNGNNLIVINNSGDCYFAGGDYHSSNVAKYDCKTIKYNSAGTLIWSATYNGTGNTSDLGAAIVLDNTGNIIVTGTSVTDSTTDIVTLKYSSGGDSLWQTRLAAGEKHNYTPLSLCTDNAGNTFLLATSVISAEKQNIVTIKYNAAGTLLWNQSFRSDSASNDIPSAMAIDNAGNVIICGTGTENNISSYTTLKYNNAGELLWARYYNPAGNSISKANALALDDSGNVYVTGGSKDSVSSDFATIKYDVDGNARWIARYNSFSRLSDIAYAIALDHEGNVFITGEGGEAFLTVKYNNSGIVQWAEGYYSNGTSYDKAKKIAVDVNGNVYVAGTTYNTSSSDFFTVLKYNPSGERQWVIKDSVGDINKTMELKLDNDGMAYLAVTSYSSATNNDFYIKKFSQDGTILTSGQFNESRNANDLLRGVVLDNTGNIYAIGSSSTSRWSIYSIVKFSLPASNVSEPGRDIATTYSLSQNYPNPFNPSTIIRYSLPIRSAVTLKIYDILGKEVATLIKETQPQGNYSVEWNAEHYATGIYFYRLEAGVFSTTKKLVLLR